MVIMGRELLVTSLRGVTEATGKSFAANAYGKAKMALQSVTIVWVILTVAHPLLIPICTYLRPFMVYLTVVVTFLSAIPYLHMARGVLSQMAVVTKPVEPSEGRPATWSPDSASDAAAGERLAIAASPTPGLFPPWVRCIR